MHFSTQLSSVYTKGAEAQRWKDVRMAASPMILSAQSGMFALPKDLGENNAKKLGIRT